MSHITMNNNVQPSLGPLKSALFLVLVVCINILAYNMFAEYNLHRLYFISLVAEIGLFLIKLIEIKR